MMRYTILSESLSICWVLQCGTKINDGNPKRALRAAYPAPRFHRLISEIIPDDGRDPFEIKACTIQFIDYSHRILYLMHFIGMN